MEEWLNERRPKYDHEPKNGEEMSKTRTIHIYYNETGAKTKYINLSNYQRTTTRQSTYALSRIRLMISNSTIAHENQAKTGKTKL